MLLLKSFIMPCIAVLWIAAVFFYPLYSGMLATKLNNAAPVHAAEASAELQSATVKPAAISGIPRHISVPAVGIDIGVDDGTYDFTNGSWSITEEAAFFATVTVPANSASGSTFIYGHNSQKVFGNLLKLEGKAEAIVTTDNGYRFVYEYKNRQTVEPTDTSVLEYEGPPRIMLQTCTGLWNENREMFYFSFKSVEKIS